MRNIRIKTYRHLQFDIVKVTCMRTKLDNFGVNICTDVLQAFCLWILFCEFVTVCEDHIKISIGCLYVNLNFYSVCSLTHCQSLLIVKIS